MDFDEQVRGTSYIVFGDDMGSLIRDEDEVGLHYVGAGEDDV